MKLTGHKTLAMFLRYNTVDEQDGIDAMAKFQDFLKEEQETEEVFAANILQGTEEASG